MSQLIVSSVSKPAPKTIAWANVRTGQIVKRSGVANSYYMKLSTGAALHFNSFVSTAAQGQVYPAKHVKYMDFVVVTKAELKIED